MTALTVNLPDEQWSKLQEVASRYGVSVEDLARAGIEDLIRRPDEMFERALEYVLDKNAELYQRLD
jgi:antitoxin FitA